MKKEVKAIIFDVGGVLQLTKYRSLGIRRHHLISVHHFMAKKLKIDLDSWFDSIDSPYAKSIEGKISGTSAISIISKNLRISKDKFIRLMFKAYKKNFKINKRLYKIARKLKEKGYKIGILSDQWELSKEALMPKKLNKGFNPIIISCDIGIRKPSPKIYKLLIKKLKLSPSEILFIDNRKWNLTPAKAFGMRIILFENNKKLIRDLKKMNIF